MKAAQLVIPEYIAWLKAQPCGFCGTRGPCDPHHYPTRGSTGYINDLACVPACRSCHDRCAGIRRVERGQRLDPIPPFQQLEAVHTIQRRALVLAPPAVLEAVARERRARDERVGQVPF